MANAQAIALCGIAVQLERIANAPDRSERIAQALENIADLVLRKGA